MKTFLSLLLLIPAVSLFAQTAPVTGRPLLSERFQLMKSGSQTFKEYKVIRESWLDGEWKVFSDSLAGMRTRVDVATATVVRLESELRSAQLALQQKEAEAARVEYDATHINFYGMNFHKTGFGVMVILMFGASLGLLALMWGRLKVTFRILREKSEIVEIVSREFEEYKRKMLDKQAKLSRELQTERNKLTDFRRA